MICSYAAKLICSCAARRRCCPRDSQIDRSDGARVTLADGWLHARASNTAPVLSLRFEAVDEAAYRRIAEQLHSALSQHASVSGTDQLDEPPIIGPQSVI